MKRKNRKPIYIFLLAVVVLYLLIYIVPKVTDIFETTDILEPGNLQVAEETEGYVIRDEQVYEAPSAGTLTYPIKEGTHVRKGTKIVDLEYSANHSDKESPFQEVIEQLGSKAIVTDSCRAKTSGVVSYHVDGWEGYFTPKRVAALKQSDLEKIEPKSENVKRESALAREPLFKICDNDNWYVLCWVDAGSISLYEVGKTVGIDFENGSIQARVEDITEDGDQWKILLWTNRYYEGFTGLRKEQIALVSQDYNGLIAENKSLTTRDGRVGVMVKNTRGEFVFTPVKIIASDGEYSALQDISFIDEEGNSVDTVNVYDEILKKPGKGN